MRRFGHFCLRRLPAAAPPAARRRFPARLRRLSPGEPPPRGAAAGLRSRAPHSHPAGVPIPKPSLPGGRGCRQLRAAVSQETPRSPASPSPNRGCPARFSFSPTITDSSTARIFQHCPTPPPLGLSGSARDRMGARWRPSGGSLERLSPVSLFFPRFP